MSFFPSNYDAEATASSGGGDFMKPAIIEESISLWLKGECRWIDMVWFWIWLWLGVERDPDNDPFWFSDPLSYGEPRHNVAASAHSGPWNACDWKEWVARFPAIGYAIRESSNY